MDAFAALAQGMLVALQPMNLLFALIGVLLGTAVGVLARHRAGADRRAAPARHLQARSGRLADHVRRHLLRRHVWRLDHRHPDQHAGRKRLDGDRARRQQDGEGRARRTGARDRRHRLLRRRHHRDHRAHFSCAMAGRDRRAIRSRRLFRADVRRLHHRLCDLRRFPRARIDVTSSSGSCSGLSASTS